MHLGESSTHLGRGDRTPYGIARPFGYAKGEWGGGVRTNVRGQVLDSSRGRGMTEKRASGKEEWGWIPVSGHGNDGGGMWGLELT